MKAKVYVVRGDALESVGDVEGLPMAYSLDYAAARLSLADNGAAIVDENNRWWGVTARGSAGGPAESTVKEQSSGVQLSPMNNFEIQVEAPGAHDGGGDDNAAKTAAFALHRRISRTVIKRFVNDASHRRFSSDDRWLALWTPRKADQSKVEVFDLARGTTLLTLNLRRAIPADVSFTAGNTMLRVDLEQDRTGSVLVPLADTAMRQFAKWLVPRDLDATERCLFGFGEAECLRSNVVPIHSGHEDRR